MTKQHAYAVSTTWTGNLGNGTADYRAYARDHRLEAAGKRPIEASSDPVFRGDAGRWNPEELFVASVSACHMLWFLHLCASAGIPVTGYADDARGEMLEQPDGSGRFTRVVLQPRVTLAAGADLQRLPALHAEAHRQCFIANSIACPVEIRSTAA
jgi:organic hydroperoxide reductase OsmC/OhrA